MSVPRSAFPTRLVISVFVYINVLLGFVVGCILQVILTLLAFPFFFGNERLRLRLLGCAFHYSTTVCKDDIITNRQCFLTRYHPKDTLLMVNHLSAADSWVVNAAIFPWELKYLFKADLLRVPFGGWALWASGDVPIRFTKEKGGWGTERGSVAKLMQRCKELIDMGIGLVIFPEGTRSRTGGLQPFKDGFFRFAVEHQCEILPCVIHNTRQLWPMGSFLVDMGRAYFAYGKPIRPNKGETVEQLKTRVHDQMLALLKLCPLHDPEVEKPLTEISVTRGQGLKGSKL